VGGSLGEALDALGRSRPALEPVTAVLVASERLGAPAGPALVRLAQELRSDLRRQAEARARTLPVKLLFPLVFLVLPAFGLLTVVPALLQALART
jgi:tight adherence protein C